MACIAAWLTEDFQLGAPLRQEPIRPITATLIRRALIRALLCILLFGSLQAWLTYRQVQHSFQVAVRNVASSNVPLLSVSVWDVDIEAIQRQVNLLLENNPSIGYATVNTNTGQQFTAGQLTGAGRGQPLEFRISQPNVPSATIGTLTLNVDTNVLYRETLRSVGVVLVQCLVLTALILGLMVRVLRRELQRPMRHLAEFVEGLKADNLSIKLDLHREPSHRRDEIDLVAEGFGTLQDRIRQHIVTLDAQVTERTQQLVSALTKLKELSTTDPLTGCYNRILFNERFPGELGRAERYVRPLSIIFCDVDRFKMVNDTYGHGTGDQVLAVIGECLRRILRVGSDWVVRYGGEEFVMVLPETSLGVACEIAERLRLEIAQQVTVPLSDGAFLNVTISLGVAEQRAGEPMTSLLHRADEWLYAAKNGGRNQVQPCAQLREKETVLSSAAPNAAN
ncbi:diguanylate cyclase [Pseudomonas jessenii]|uniref:diguanylate cyclase n=1 Tax=Pseudomonas jessenii TaxID=77298 RepID=UPI003892A262